MSQAWHTAILYRADKIPALSDLLGDPAEPQSDDDMTFNLAAFAAVSASADARA